MLAPPVWRYSDGMELFDSTFPGKNGAAALFDGTHWTLHHARLAQRRFKPCSTFKLYLALMGLESGVIRNPKEVWTYTGEKVGQAPGRRSMNLEEALQESSEWYFREVARKLGAERLRAGVAKLHYGGGWTGTKPETAWIDETLQISPEEQARLAWAFEREMLPFLKSHQRSVKQSLRVEGLSLWGKTGSSQRGDDGMALGWYVGAMKVKGQTLSFAVLRRAPDTIGPKVRDELARRIGSRR